MFVALNHMPRFKRLQFDEEQRRNEEKEEKKGFIQKGGGAVLHEARLLPPGALKAAVRPLWKSLRIWR